MNIAHNKKKKSGFTLLELLVVMGILIFTSTMIGAGIVYLQNSVRLDNAVRTLKSEIQSTQNNARNSFVAYQANTSPTDQTNVNFYTQRKLNIGWIVEITNVNNTIRITKRSVYLDTASIADQSSIILDNLRIQVKLFKDSNSGLYCNNDTLFNSQGATSLNLGSTIPIKCSTSLVGETEVANDIIGSVIEVSGNSLCTLIGGKYSLFFTAGYGEPAIGNSNCQIRIKNSGSFGVNTRSIMIDRNTATATVCGNDCFKVIGIEEGEIIELPTPTTRPPLVTPTRGDTTDPIFL